MNDTEMSEEQGPPKVLSRYALGARRLLSDQAVQALYAEMEATFLQMAISGNTAELREHNRINLLCLQGLFSTLQDIARNNLPPFMRDRDEQVVKTGDGATIN